MPLVVGLDIVRIVVISEAGINRQSELRVVELAVQLFLVGMKICGEIAVNDQADQAQ